MRMDSKKIMALMGTAMLAMGVLAGCSGSAGETTAAAAATTADGGNLGRGSHISSGSS